MIAVKDAVCLFIPNSPTSVVQASPNHRLERDDRSLRTLRIARYTATPCC